ncbi:hypothetical protein IFM47457_03910 [Aspergillus lentulus]|nr:hypothetical protein IFM47457_03910 [Aspergillus lentulus]
MAIFISPLIIVATNQSFIFEKTTLSASRFQTPGPLVDGLGSQEKEMRVFVDMVTIVGCLMMIFDWSQFSLAYWHRQPVQSDRWFRLSKRGMAACRWVAVRLSWSS